MTPPPTALPRTLWPLVACFTLLFGVARGQASNPNSAECRRGNLAAHLKTIKAVCCTSPSMCVKGMPSDQDKCSLECARVFAPLYDECKGGLLAMGVGPALTGFYRNCLETRFPPGRCGKGCTNSNLSCRSKELDRACCSQPGSCAKGAIVPNTCSVECALVAIPFMRDCTPLLHMPPTTIAKLNQFALRTCAGQDLTTLVEYGADLFEKGCSIEFGVSANPDPPAWRAVTPKQIAQARCTRVAGANAHVRVHTNGRQLDFLDYQENGAHSGVLRCDIPVPPFTKVRGDYSIRPVDPVTGQHQDPDNDFSIRMWSQDPPGHSGSFAFGTEHDIVDHGAQMGKHTTSFDAAHCHDRCKITIPATTVTLSRFVRIEVCQSANHEDFSLLDFNLEVFTAGLDASNLIKGGGFEAPVAKTWQVVSAGGKLPGGWTVQKGNIDYGKYQAAGHCKSPCAFEGVQFLDLCGSGAGRLQQTVPTKVGMSYILSYAINGHQHCGLATKTMKVFVDRKLIALETFKRSGKWQDHSHEWVLRAHTVQATKPLTAVVFESVSNSCGCMLLDDVQMVPRSASWWQPAAVVGGSSVGGGHRRQMQAGSFFSTLVTSSSKCPWDNFDEHLFELEKVCCMHDTCTGKSPPTTCTPLCAIGMRSFMRSCKTTLGLLAQHRTMEVFAQHCHDEGSINVPLFVDALSNAKCCSSRNCGGCTSQPTCGAVDAGDVSGDSAQCIWAGDALPSHGALVSEGKPARQSTTLGGGVASRAVDGNSNPSYSGGKSCSHTKAVKGTPGSWWQVDLGEVLPISHVTIQHRADCCQKRALGARVIVSMTTAYQGGTTCGVLKQPGRKPERLECHGIRGQYVTITEPDKPDNYLTLCEVQVYAQTHAIVGRAGQTRCDATGNWYEFVATKGFVKWETAKQKAEKRGGHLATITSQAENDCVKQLSKQCGWLGGNDISVEGRWEWVTGEKWSFQSWSPGEPNVAAEDFLGMNWPGQKTGSWHDCGDGCGNQRGYFVEYETQMLSGCVRLGQRYPIYDIDGGGWMLVRRVQPGLTWHPATDGLSGTQAAYGKWTNDPTSQSTFNIRFDTIPYDQFLFATGDGQEWLIANRNEVQTIHPGIFQGAIEKSSLHPSTPSSAQWYHRRNNKEDPWISLTDHASAIGRGNLLYGEDKFGKAHASKVLPVHNGANVFIRLQANRKGCVEHQITKAGKAVCSVMNPGGGGNHNIQVIMDGVKPQKPQDAWVGYTFTSEHKFSKLVFQEGKHFYDGGWFERPPHVEVLIAAVWTPVKKLSTKPRYQESSRVGSGATSFETFVFTFDTVKAMGIRLRGQAGGKTGGGPFISIGELAVFALQGADC